MDEQPTDEQIRKRTFFGWLRPYILALDAMFLKRWDYWLRTVDAGKVLDEPIPQIEWEGTPNKEAKKNLEECIDRCRDRFARDAFDLFIEWLLFGFGDPVVKEFPKQVGLKLNADWYKKFNLGLMLKYPYDYLGEFAAEMAGKGRNNPTGYFPTPMNVCVMMAAMTLWEADKTNSVCDPCVGSGRLLMAASNYSLNLYGMDIDYKILRVCKANMFVYVPWGVGRPSIEGLEGVKQPMKREDALTAQPIQRTTGEVQRKLLNQSKQLSLFESVGDQ